MEILLVTTVEGLEDLQALFNLEDCGMSGNRPGWHWFQDDDAQLTVYFKLYKGATECITQATTESLNS